MDDNTFTKEEVIEFGLTFPGTYQNAPFRDTSWQLVRIKESTKVFLWVYEKDGELCINVKVNDDTRWFWRNAYKAVIPGYHQNKEHWNTVILNGSIPKEDVKIMIEQSYELVKKKKLFGNI